MKKFKFDKLDITAFESLDKKRMKNVRGGYTAPTYTYTNNGPVSDGQDSTNND